MLKVLVRGLSVNLLLVRTASVVGSAGVAALELVDSLTTRVLLRANVSIEASVLCVVGVEATLVDAATIRLGVLNVTGHIADVGWSLTSVVLALAAATSGRVLASVEAKFLLGGG